MFQVGDIVKDISEHFGDRELTGIVVDILIIYKKPVFHVRFFGADEVSSLYANEIQKVS